MSLAGFTPRKAETAPVVALLEREDFAGPEQLAGAIVRAVASALLEREWHLSVVQDPDSPHIAWAYGLCASRKAAEHWALTGAPPMRRMVIPVVSAQGQIGKAEGL